MGSSFSLDYEECNFLMDIHSGFYVRLVAGDCCATHVLVLSVVELCFVRLSPDCVTTHSKGSSE